ncbi:hypothetical protein AVEN_212828-1, partial [Araneus ventricosus]
MTRTTPEWASHPLSKLPPTPEEEPLAPY